MAAATILNVFLFALAWKGTQIEKRDGEPPWSLVLGLLAYLGALGAFVYFSLNRPLVSGFDVFMVAFGAQAMGGAIVHALLHAFIFSRGQRKADRAFAFVGALFLAGIMVAGVLGT
ncbi:hypothetical protein ASF60_22445 [Methylobacterium sp. Leaf113]|uniref:hypothetical protein n=2 Tax=unclassified Methylobacterium TaxID=2615210 RepID=UPI0006F53C80|nr:hypothetical protein [Methylobacterium sp. Leaf113]KQP81130.1 hypothetical protein ASF60_22445 [Methylobacterium sp. Leaf113]